MAKANMQVWRSVTLLFLSKFVTSTTQTFTQKDLINEKNTALGARFASMLGSETEEPEVKTYLKKTLKQLEQEKLLHRSSTGEIHLTREGMDAMNAERSRAMAKIAQNFPGSVPQEQNTASGKEKTN